MQSAEDRDLVTSWTFLGDKNWLVSFIGKKKKKKYAEAAYVLGATYNVVQYIYIYMKRTLNFLIGYL